MKSVPQKKKKLIAGLIGSLLVLLGSVAYVERTRILTWYYVWGLSRATDGNRDAWMKPIVQMDTAAVPGLIDGLQTEDEQACANNQAALGRLVDTWGLDDPRTTDLTGRVVRAFSQMSLAGKRLVLHWMASILTKEPGASPPAPVANMSIRLLIEVGRENGSKVNAQALELAEVVLKKVHGEELPDGFRDFMATCPRDADAENRMHFLRLAQQSPQQLLKEVLPLLHDSEAEIRRQAVSAVGAEESAISTDELLHSLHDPDKEVRQLCETALRGRHLSEQQMELGRLITDDRPSVRLQVLDYLSDEEDDEVEPAAWLGRLCEDPSPVVRAAAIRAASEQRTVDLSDRIEQMACSDPSPTVCQLARYYLSYLKSQKPNLVKP